MKSGQAITHTEKLEESAGSTDALSSVEQLEILSTVRPIRQLQHSLAASKRFKSGFALPNGAYERTRSGTLLKQVEPDWPSCSTLAHLRWTLSYPWQGVEGGTPLKPAWVERASSWRDGRADTPAWVESLASVPDELCWEALQVAHRHAGLDPSFRTGEAYCRQRRYGNRPGLEQRFVAKLNRDGLDCVSPVARAIRGFLDIIHVHPFSDGNGRAACTWLAWSLVAGGYDVPTLEPLVRLPFNPTSHRIPPLMQAALS